MFQWSLNCDVHWAVFMLQLTSITLYTGIQFAIVPDVEVARDCIHAYTYVCVCIQYTGCLTVIFHSNCLRLNHLKISKIWNILYMGLSSCKGYILHTAFCNIYGWIGPVCSAILSSNSCSGIGRFSSTKLCRKSGWSFLGIKKTPQIGCCPQCWRRICSGSNLSFP